jgi:ribonuclease D
MDLPARLWIDHPAGLGEPAAAAGAAPWIALDTEANSMFVYREQVCLLQLNLGGRLFLVDTLALAPPADALGVRTPSPALAPLAGALGDPAIPLYLHGGEYDVGCLKRDYGISLRGVWDSQQAASLLGWEKTGYGAVVERVCGVVLDKAFTQYDWATRPLSPGAERYALDDVIYLPQVCDQLRELVRAADLEEEVQIANQAVEATSWSGGFDPAGFWRIKGVREVPAPCLGVLTALYAWRDALARSCNLPPGRLLNNEVLLAVARQQPTNFQLLKKMGLRSWFLAAHGEALIAVLRTATADPPAVPARPRGREVAPEEEERETRLKDWRRAEAERRTREEARPVPLQVVLPARALEFLKQHGAGPLDQVPQLGAKRIRRYGDKLLELCRRG